MFLYETNRASQYIGALQDQIFKLQPDKQNVSVFLEGLKQVEVWGVLYFLKIMQENQVFLTTQKRYSLEEIREEINVLSAYFRLVESLLDILMKHGYIRYFDDGFYGLVCARNVTFEQMHHQKNQILKNYPMLKSSIDFMHNVLDAYASILSGQRSFLDILFPKGSFEILESMYKNNSNSAYYNTLSSLAVSIYANQSLQKSGSKISILEIGAGIGSTTAQVLPMLNSAKSCAEYCYTDISKAFIKYGIKKFNNDFDFLKFDTLDISKSLLSQGFKEQSRDVILATNVLHVAPDIVRTLENISSILKPGGILVLNEGTAKRDYSTFIFGLTSGWWAFVDDKWRIPGSPLITLSTWQRLFKESNLEFIVSLNHLDNSKDDSEQNVLVAMKIDKSL